MTTYDGCYVLDMMRSALKKIEDGRVRVIQFIDRNTIHGTQVCLSFVESRARLFQPTLHLHTWRWHDPVLRSGFSTAN